ncbi:MAG: isochorismatase family protein [Oscillospiraceae bacterium]
MNNCITTGEFDNEKETMIDDLYEKAALLRAAQPLILTEADAGDTLLISVDVNNGFAVSGALCCEEATRLITPTAMLFARAKQMGFETLAFCDRHTDASPELDTFPDHCLVESGEDTIPAGLARHVDRVIYKNSTNGFLAAPHDVDWIRYRRVVVTGCLTELCVFQLATTLRAYYNEHDCAGREIVVPLNLIDTYDAPTHSALLHNIIYAVGMAEAGVHLVSELVL